MGEAIKRQKPDFVVVQGDTTTAAITAMSAFHNKVPVFHNEAGLRSYNLHHPFPEEANRRWISVVADRHFAPTETAKKALLQEGVAEEDVLVTGNPGVDSLFWTVEQRVESKVLDQVKQKVEQGLKPVLITSHRRENSGSFMDNWFRSLKGFGEKHPELFFICPLHPNQLAREHAERHLGGSERALLCEPLSYAETCHTLKQCFFVVTDSGGIQEEAVSLGVPVVVCRKVTERMEGVKAGWSRLADPQETEQVLDGMKWAYDLAKAPPEKSLPFGDGRASQVMARGIGSFLELG
jgi:UDP-N-acetylglucosamine 2-epimerase (non-hydrolysing)